MDNIAVKDIRTYVSINNKQEFCLDTNVLYWYTYPRYNLDESSGRLKEVQYYYDFVDQLVAAGNPLITTRYNISELINIIEKHEYNIFCKSDSSIPYTKKDFRRNLEKRRALQKILKTTLNNVAATCQVIDFSFTEETLAACVDTLDNHRCDVFDFMILDHYKKTNHLNIISDDSDFASVSGITLFTANEISLSQK
jgi:predicted nucleic acid-binding protein